MDIKSVNFLSKAGYKYILRFRKEDENFGGINVVSISFDLHSDKFEPLELKDIFSIAKIFEQYILQNNVILTYICDNEPVKTSVRNKSLSPQKFRSTLFDRMFKRINKQGKFYKKDLIIKNKLGDEYLSFISFLENADSVDKCIELVPDK